MASHKKCQNPGCSNSVDKPWFPLCTHHVRMTDCKNPGCSNKVDKYGFPLCNYHYQMPSCKNLGCDDRVEQSGDNFCQQHSLKTNSSLDVPKDIPTNYAVASEKNDSKYVAASVASDGSSTSQGNTLSNLIDVISKLFKDNQSSPPASSGSVNITDPLTSEILASEEYLHHSNQGFVTDTVFSREGKAVLTYNEMKFGSRAEIEIAKALEEQKVLFFPLPLAVRRETGIPHQDHREPDFLVCYEGAWGILEVAHHTPERYEKDKEKDAWFKESGILCVEHYTAEACSKDPHKVVDKFLKLLIQFKNR